MSENNPHDHFFHQMMTKRETAEDIIKEYFPTEITKCMDLKTLKISKNTFIDNENRKHESDILYEIEVDGVKTNIYLLFEHKSYDYKYTALQLLRYMSNIWRLDIKQKRLTENKKLKPIIPFVFYTSEEDWSRGRTFHYLMDKMPEPLKKHIPDYEYLMLNLNTEDFDKIKGELLTRIMLKTMKIVFMDSLDLEEKIREIFHLMKLYKRINDSEETRELFRLLIRYLLRAARYLEKEQIERTVEQELPEWRSDYMTIADVLKKEGREEGKEEGRAEGAYKKALEASKKMIEDGLSLELISKYEGLELEELEKLKKEVEQNK